MIVSLCREEDKQIASDVLAIAESVASLYARTRDEKLVGEIERLMDWYDQLLEKIHKYDYTEDDKRRMRIDRRIWELHQAVADMSSLQASPTTENTQSQRGNFKTDLPK